MEVTTMSQAMQLHAQAIKLGAQPHSQDYRKVFTFSALSPSGDLNYARLILNSLRTPNSYYWNTMLRAYCETSDAYQCISLFLAMHKDHSSGIAPNPDKFTYPFVAKSCGRLRDTKLGKQVHCLICKMGFGSDKYICNYLIRMYAKCHHLDYALKVFDKMPERDVVTWTSIIDGIVDNGRAIEAIKLFKEMLDVGVEPNDATIVSVLRACAETGTLEVGKRAHRIAEEQGFDSRANVSTALIDMYSKCGCIDSARKVFNDVSEKDVCTWTAMIRGLASHGMSKEAVNSFHEMKNSGVLPDEQTMTAVLAACRNAGWVTEADLYFKDMKMKYGIKPNLQHHLCMVDLYAQSGKLKEAEDFIRKMAIPPDAVLWRTVIRACKIHGNTDRAERLIKEMKIDLDECDSCVLVSNIITSNHQRRPHPPPPATVLHPHPSPPSTVHPHLPPPSTVLRFHTSYREKLTYLRTLGIVDSDPKTTSVPSHKTLDQILTFINYLKSRGISDNDIPKLSTTCPKLFSSNLEPSDISPVFSFLATDVAASVHESCGLILCCPSLLLANVEYCLKPTLAFLRSIGLKRLNSPTNLNAHLLNTRISKLEAKMEFLQRIGFTNEESKTVCARLPALFGYSIEENLMPKVEYLVGGMQRSIEEVKEFPQYFAFSLRKRIVPRHLHLKQRNVDVSLKRMLLPGDEKFYAKWK